MNASPELLSLVSEWHRLDAEAEAILHVKGATVEEQDRASDLCQHVLYQIRDYPAVTAADLVVKLRFAAAAYFNENEESFVTMSEPPAWFIWPLLRDAKRLAGGAS